MLAWQKYLSLLSLYSQSNVAGGVAKHIELIWYTWTTMSEYG